MKLVITQEQVTRTYENAVLEIRQDLEGQVIHVVSDGLELQMLITEKDLALAERRPFGATNYPNW